LEEDKKLFVSMPNFFLVRRSFHCSTIASSERQMYRKVTENPVKTCVKV